jgi:predicted transcriptional regulator of viral defense system
MAATHQKQQQLLDLARGQGGYFTASQASSVGFEKNNRHRFVKNGVWTQVRRGIFRISSEPEPLHGDLHWLALFFKHRDGRPSAIFGLETAAQIHGMGDYMPSHVNMLVEPNFQKRSPPPDHVEIHVVLSIKHEVQTVEGLPVTSPLRTIVDLLQQKDRDPEETRRAFLQARSAGIIVPKMIACADWLEQSTRALLLEWEKQL